jgi:hypothetical protein
LPYIKIDDFEGEPKQFGKEILKHMKQSIGGTVLSSFSSVSFFDSPVIAADGIIRYISGVLSIQ